MIIKKHLFRDSYTRAKSTMGMPQSIASEGMRPKENRLCMFKELKKLMNMLSTVDRNNQQQQRITNFVLDTATALCT